MTEEAPGWTSLSRSSIGAKEVPGNFTPIPFAYHEEIELSVENLTNLGLGVGRVKGWVVLLPFVLKGECVRARIFKNHKNYSEADLLEVLESSPYRREAKCPLFGLCGGCQYQHIAYEEQRRIKQQQIREFFHRSGWTDIEVPLPLSGEEWAYRTKLTPHFQKPKAANFPIGFLRRGSRRALVDIPHCPIATEAINESLHQARSEIRSKSSYRRGQTLLFRDIDGRVCRDPRRLVEQQLDSLVFSFRAGGFFQNNAQVLPPMLRYIARKVSEGSSADFLIDAYGGVGVFALSAAASFQEVMGIEIDEDAVALARRNAEQNQIRNASFVRGSAEAIFEKIRFPADRSVVIIDPPRRGCNPTFLQQLLRFHPRKIISISCEPSTQIRDLRELLQDYRLHELQPFDLFPQTRHIENIAVLGRD
ncbi:MAG: class I SAM-dependent RNA methyltransferase [Puniceicoccales bacterium]|jgi:23S rRNA (uracil1939-C5)-methyltransferase/tRNA (uracil-5-)-methyltransferase|nr:class I SAM-dependent RNA methyltransferase [Puniceicoccales bacterium]